MSTSNFERVSGLVAEAAQAAGPTVPHRDIALSVASRFSETDLGNADRLIAHHGDSLRFTTEAGWMAYDGRRWNRAMGAARARDYANQVARSIAAEADFLADEDARKDRFAWAMQSGSNSRIKGMLETATPDLTVSIEEFDKEEHLLCLENGVVDLNNGEIYEHTPERMMSLIAGSVFDPYAVEQPEAPTWEAFLNDIMLGDAEMVAFLKRAVGYSMFASANEQVAFFCTGDEEHKKQNGSNGKSLFLSMLLAAAGEYGTTVTRTLIVEKNHEGVSNDVAKLKGKRIAVGSEFKRKDVIAAEAFKRLTGDETVEARFLHKEFFDFENKATMWWATNYIPMVSDQDDGVWRRMVIIPFLAKFWPKEKCPPGGKVKDTTLKKRLMDELPGIMRWCIEGAMEYAAAGRLDIPARLFAQSEAKQAEFDPLRDFLAACVVIDEKAATPAVDLRRVYERFCELNSMEPLSVTAFGRRLNEEGIVKDEAMTRAKGVVYRRGAKLAPAAVAYRERRLPEAKDRIAAV